MRPPSLVFPPLSELAWYPALEQIVRWAGDASEGELVRRVTTLALRFAGLSGRPAGSCVAMARGLAQTVYCRIHGVRVVDRLESDARRRWESFVAEAGVLPRAVFVSAHLGPFQLQMDLLAGLPQEKFFLYTSYRWPPLAERVASLRLRAPRMRYIDVRKTRDIVKAMQTGGSPALMGDAAPGRPGPADFPVRMACRYRLPLFIGGLFNSAATLNNGASRFGFDYYRVDPADLETTARAYAAAMGRTILNNPSDWIRFD